MVARHLPDTRKVFYLAIHPAPCNEALWELQREANRRVRALCERWQSAEYMDYLHLLFDEGGAFRADIFLPDRLHYAPAFYR